MIELFLAIIMVSVAVYYVTDVLLLVTSEFDKGPFESKTKKVVWVRVMLVDGDVIHRQRDERPVNAWDWVRRAFGLYEVFKEDDEELWYVLKDRSPLWECPHCLGFWIGLLPSLIIVGYLPLTEGVVSILIWIPVALVVSGFNSVLVSVIDALYNRHPEGIIYLDEDEHD